MNYIISTFGFEGLPTVTIAERNEWIVATRLFDGYSIFTDVQK